MKPKNSGLNFVYQGQRAGCFTGQKTEVILLSFTWKALIAFIDRAFSFVKVKLSREAFLELARSPNAKIIVSDGDMPEWLFQKIKIDYVALKTVSSCFNVFEVSIFGIYFFLN